MGLGLCLTMRLLPVVHPPQDVFFLQPPRPPVRQVSVSMATGDRLYAQLPGGLQLFFCPLLTIVCCLCCRISLYGGCAFVYCRPHLHTGATYVCMNCLWLDHFSRMKF